MSSLTDVNMSTKSGSETCLLYTSEIKAILADPEVKPEVDPNMIDRLLTFDYIPGEETLFRNIRKLAPGTSMMVKAGRAQIRQYWDLNFTRSSLSLAQAEGQLEALLEESVKLAEEMAQWPPLAIRRAKRVLQHNQDAELDAALRYESVALGHARKATNDTKESIAAFAEKRKGVYTGT